MVKQVLLIALFILLSTILLAQEKKEKYCEVRVVLGGRHLGGIIIDSGYATSIPVADSTINTELSKIREHNSVADLLNYIGKRGWLLVSASHLGVGEFRKYFYFKKYVSQD